MAAFCVEEQERKKRKEVNTLEHYLTNLTVKCILVGYFGYTLQKMSNCYNSCLKSSRVERNNIHRTPSKFHTKSDYSGKIQVLKYIRWIIGVYNNTDFMMDSDIFSNSIYNDCSQENANVS